MTMRIKLPGGTLKIKRRRDLRSTERLREVPVLNIGPLYFVWWKRSRR